MCKLLFITGFESKESHSFEKEMKGLFLPTKDSAKEKSVTLCFEHSGSLAEEIRDLVRRKKPTALIFNENCPLQKIQRICKMLSKSMGRNNMPAMFTLSTKIIEGLQNATLVKLEKLFKPIEEPAEKAA